MTGAQVFLAAIGIGFGGAMAQWACVQLAGVINMAFRAAYDRQMRARMLHSVFFCAQCAGPCATILQCKNPACGWHHLPAEEPTP
jgi:hypothetical protein